MSKLVNACGHSNCSMFLVTSELPLLQDNVLKLDSTIYPEEDFNDILDEEEEDEEPVVEYVGMQDDELDEIEDDMEDSGLDDSLRDDDIGNEDDDEEITKRVCNVREN
ncbi:hypothetical protein MKW98_005910 [Papaver atlanticum]|uniref:Uncharacterized protein n=1 Tax=Papaver atlanticum TaxID=357466 RepID=A0AAD4TE10_9MAGN|nr:hypothetical protein MKW98_005910 [Papaver atlanticum]